MHEPSQYFPYPATVAQIAWLALLTIVSIVNMCKREHVNLEPVIVRRKKPPTMLRQDIAKKQTCKHEEEIAYLQKELCAAKTSNDELLQMLRKQQEEKDELQQELCQEKMEHEQALKDRCLAEMNHEEKLHELHLAYFETDKRNKECIENLQLELYHAKMGQNNKVVQEPPVRRVESILLHKLDSTSISDENMLKVMRTAEPRLRRADMYNSLRSLQNKGLVRKQSNTWIKTSQTQSSSKPPYYQDCKY